MTNETYNGWANRSTWNVMLWLDNDEAMYHGYVAAVKRVLANGHKLTAGRAKAIALDVIGETTPDNVNVTAKCIDWKAIAEAMLESVN